MVADWRYDLSELGNQIRWDNLLAKAKTIPDGLMTEYERGFVANMIRRDLEERPIWSPSRKQYNYLHTLCSKV